MHPDAVHPVWAEVSHVQLGSNSYVNLSAMIWVHMNRTICLWAHVYVPILWVHTGHPSGHNQGRTVSWIAAEGCYISDTWRVVLTIDGLVITQL